VSHIKLGNIFKKSSKIHIDYDLTCILECAIEKDNIICTLKNINGRKKKELIGLDISEINLNELLPENIRSIHDTYIKDIILNKDKSQYWKRMIDGTMNRPIEIINPFTQMPHSIKIAISFKNTRNNKLYFDIYMTDLSIVNNIINKTALLTHDMRSIIKSAINITSEIKKISVAENNVMLFSVLEDLLNEAHEMCSHTRVSLLPKHTDIDEEGYVILYKTLLKFIKIFNLHFEKLNITLKINTTISIHKGYVDSLNHLLFNIVKNANNVKASNVEINLCNVNDEINIYVKDNGCGMSTKQMDMFLRRQLPEVQKNVDIDGNRGEGFLLSYNDWKKYGGEVKIVESIINMGTTFLISIKGHNDRTSIPLEMLHTIISIEKKIVLFIDDSALILKLLYKKLTNFKADNSSIEKLTYDLQNHGISIIEHDEYFIILCTSGILGKEVSILNEPQIIVTDIEMPKYRGTLLIKELRENGINSHILINSSCDKTDVLTEIAKLMEITNIDDITNIDFINKEIFDIKQYINEHC
jgi:CheY-like chemotaxis protein